MQAQQAVFNWSGGKDSALCLHRVLRLGQYTVSHLLTSVNAHYRRVSMHGVRTELLQRQAESIGIPLVQAFLPEMPDMQIYEAIMGETLTGIKREGAQVCIFGDIFLEDLRQYREQKLAEIDMRAIFPLWKVPTGQLITEFLDLGFKAVIVCVDEKYLDQSFAGRTIDRALLDDLPRSVDPCGEYGEFHTFVYDGPIFKQPIAFELGEVVYRKYTPTSQNRDAHYTSSTNSSDPFDSGFWYRDLLPVPGN